MNYRSAGIQSEQGEIVVGVDGSPSSTAALDWAMQQARLSGASVHAVTTWELPKYYGSSAPWPADIDFEAIAEGILNKATEGVEISKENPEIVLKKSVVYGRPGLVLLNMAKNAAMLVVGSRGHGEFAGMLLGSVSEHLATHALCPVVIVHDSREATA